MLTPTEQTYYEFLQDSPSTVTQVCKHFHSNYHSAYNHLKSLETKGYVARRPGDGTGYEFYVPEHLRIKAGSFRMGLEEQTIEEIIAAAWNLKVIESHVRMSALAVAHLIHHSMLPRPDQTDPKAVIIKARKILADYLNFLDRVSRMSPELLREQMGEFHPQDLNEWEEKWQQHNKTTIEIMSYYTKNYFDGETASWKDVEIE